MEKVEKLKRRYFTRGQKAEIVRAFFQVRAGQSVLPMRLLWPLKKSIKK